MDVCTERYKPLQLFAIWFRQTIVLTGYSVPVAVWSIVMSMSVCLSVCLSHGYVYASGSQEPNIWTSPNLLCMLHMIRSSSGGAVCNLLPVLRMRSYSLWRPYGCATLRHSVL